MTSTTSPEIAAAAAKRILGFYETIPASDPKAFAAALVQTLSIFPPSVVERACDPVKGIPAHVARLNLAEIRKHLDGWFAGELRREDFDARFNRPKLVEHEPDPASVKRVSDGLRQLSAQLKANIGPIA